MKKGLFITFEGADGCGKTTQLEMTANYLKGKGYDVITTREPGAEKLGKTLREILLHYDGEISSRSELFLYLADRAQHIDMVVKPAIERGTIVLCDRHTDSTLAYQGYGRGLDLDQLKKLNNIAVNGCKPDLTLLYDVSVEVAQTRVGKEKDRLESEGVIFHNKVRNGYLELAKNEPQRFAIIDASLSIDAVFEKTKNALNACVTIK